MFRTFVARCSQHVGAISLAVTTTTAFALSQYKGRNSNQNHNHNSNHNSNHNHNHNHNSNVQPVTRFLPSCSNGYFRPFFSQRMNVNVSLKSFQRSTQCESSHQHHDSDDDYNAHKEGSAPWYYERMDDPIRFQEDHAIFSTLMKATKQIESYTVYRRVPDLSAYHPTEVAKHKDEAVEEDFTSNYIVVNAIREPILVDPNATEASSSSSTDKDKDNSKTKMEYPDATEVTLCIFKIGKSLQGHVDVIHGGIISLLFDDSMGFAYEAVSKTPTWKKFDPDPDHKWPRWRLCSTKETKAHAVTANLNINFRSPLWQEHVDEQKILLRIYHEKTIGRKIYLKAILTSMDEKIIYADAQGLYLWMPPEK